LNFEIKLSENEEPPLILKLLSENETHYFIENQPKKWDGLSKNSEATIEIYDWKLFPHNNLEFEVLEIIDTSGKKSLLVFQDSLSDSKENSKESLKTMKRIKQTFKIN